MPSKTSAKKQTGGAQQFSPEQKRRLIGLTKELETQLEDYKEELEKTIMRHIRFQPHGGRKKAAPKS